MIKTRRGDVVLLLFPNSDLRTSKRRPALVIQRNNLNGGMPQTIVAMIQVILLDAVIPAEFSSQLIPQTGGLPVCD
jgi:mRNA interferase MazF